MSYSVLSKTYYLKAGDEESRMQDGESFRRTILADLTLKEKIKKLYLNFTTLKGQYHPRFFGLISGISSAIFLQNKEDENLEILLGQFPFFLILLISIYKIGTLLYDNNVGIFLSFFVSFLPIIFPHLRVPMIDLPLTAMYTLSILFLLKTRYFSSLLYSICGGIIWGLAQLTKESFLIFFLPIFVYYILISLKKHKENPSLKPILTNIVASCISFVLITGIVYLNPRNYGAMKIYSLKSSLKLYKYRSYNFLWYIFIFPFIYFYPIIFAALFPFFIIYLFKVKSKEKNLFFYSSIISLILFSISPNKSVRFLMPLVPIFVLMCTAGIYESLKGKTRTTYLVCLITFLVFQFNMINSQAPLYLKYYAKVVSKFAAWSGEHGVLFSFQRQKDKEYLKVSESFSKILQSEHSKEIIITTTFIEHRIPAVLRKELRRQEIKGDIIACAHDASYIVLSLTKFSNNFEELIRHSNYIFDCNEMPLYPSCSNIKNAFIRNKDLFTLLSEIPLYHEDYGDIKILVYKNKKP